MKVRVCLLVNWLSAQVASLVIADAAQLEVALAPNSLRRPSLHAIGTQFDLTNAFAYDLSRTGWRQFWTTQDAGRSWNSLRLVDQHKREHANADVKIHYYYGGKAIIQYNDTYYCTQNGSELKECAISSVAVRGQDGFKLGGFGRSNPCLARTVSGGKEWVDVPSTNLWFDGIESFDIVTKDLIYGCVYISGAERGSRHRLARSMNGGASWAEVCDLEQTPGIWATHVFFLNVNNGWISSDRDDGLFLTSNAGRTWRKIKVPERVISGIFFKNSRQGRIIGGVQRQVYETSDGGQSWRKLSRSEVVATSFIEYFGTQLISRWNDFALIRTLLVGPVPLVE